MAKKNEQDGKRGGDGDPREQAAPEQAAREQVTPDVLLVHRRTDDGQGVQGLRLRPSRVELAELRPLKEGVPISGEVVSLKPREGSPVLFDVETRFDPRAGEADSSGRPARVSSAAYRRNWDAIFAQRRPRARRSSGGGDDTLPN